MPPDYLLNPDIVDKIHAQLETHKVDNVLVSAFYVLMDQLIKSEASSGEVTLNKTKIGSWKITLEKIG